jgi:uncharacterized membrane protein
MVYELLKAGHIVAVVIWFGGMMAIALLLGRGEEMAASLQSWDRYVTTPAMIAAWILGLTMATWAGWFASGWMMAKVVFVLALSGVHGVLSGRLRRTAAARQEWIDALCFPSWSPSSPRSYCSWSQSLSN